MHEPAPSSKAVYIGLTVGCVAMLGGIFMFMYVVPRDLASNGELSGDLNILFTRVFTGQLNYFNEKGRYADALMELNVEPEACAHYSCRLTVPPSGGSFRFRMSIGGQTWAVDQSGPRPRLETK